MKLIYVVTNLLTGSLIDEVELNSCSWNELLSRPGAGKATARIDTPSTTRANFDSWNNALWVIDEDSSDILFGGIIGSVSPVSGTRVVNVPLYGFAEYYRTRLLRGRTGMTYAGGTMNEILWTNVDLFRVVSDLFAHAHSVPSGNINVSLTFDALLGTTITRSYYDYEYKPIAVAFEQLADLTPGFYWSYVYSYSGNSPRASIKLRPRTSQATGAYLDYDGDIVNTSSSVLSIDADSTEKPVNGVAIVGAGEGDTMVRTYVSDLNTGGPLYEAMLSNKDVSELTTLDAQTQLYLSRNKIRRPRVKLEIDPMKIDFKNIRVGDYAVLAIDDGWNNYTGNHAIIEKNIHVKPTGEIELKFGLEAL